MRPRIWLCFAEQAWLELAEDDNGTIPISRIAARTRLRRDSLTVDKVAIFEGITIEVLRSALGSTSLGSTSLGSEEESALPFNGDALTPVPAEGAPSSKWSGVGHQPLDRWMMTGNRTDGIRSGFLNSVCSMRESTVHGLCGLILQKGAVLLRAPPQSGKTSLLDLIMHSESAQAFKRVFYISLALISSMTFNDIWGIYVERNISFFDVLKSPNSSPEGKHKQHASQANMPPYLLLVDEGHVGFKQNLALWHVLKSVQSGKIKHLRMLIVSAWCSSDIATDVDSAWGSNDNATDVYSVPTPGSWGSDSVVSLRPTHVTPIGLQLTVDEALELWESWRMGAGLDESIRDHIFVLTDRQPGLLTHVIDWLEDINLNNIASEKCEEEIRKLLLSSDFCDHLSSIRSIMRLSKGIAKGRHVKPLREFLRVLLQKCEVSYGRLSEEQLVGARLALEWGQVVEFNDTGGRILKLPSRIHEIYFMKQLYQNKNEDACVDGLEAFVEQVVERMNPGQLKSSVSWTVSDNRLYEKQYQAEFYRAALTVLPGGSWLSPDAGKLLGADGFIDFYLSEPYSWGFELVRDGNRLQEHLDRFTEGGIYSGLLRNGRLKDHVILGFKMKGLDDMRGDKHLIQVVFSADFKTTVLSGSRIRNGGSSIAVRGDAWLRT